MAILLASGEKANILEQSVVTSSPSAHAVDGLSGLSDGRPSIPTRFVSIPTNGYFQWDSNRSANGGLESAPLVGWVDRSQGAGFSIADEPTLVNAGAHALKLITAAVGSSFAQGTYDILEVRAGQRCWWTCALRGDGTRTARFRIQNLVTGKYWNGTTWQTAAFDLATRSTATYATTSGVLTVESYAACRRPSGLVTLRLIAIATDATAGAAYADDMYIGPSWDLFSIHGHRYLDPVVTCEVLSGTDGSTFPTTRATPTIYQPSFYSWLATPSDDRYGRIRFPGTALDLITIGEGFVGQALSLQEPENWPIEMKEIEPDVHMETETGDAWVYTKTYHNRRALGMSFEFATHVAQEEARDEVFRRSRGRKTPMVIVPDTTRPEVILGRITRDWRVLRKFLEFYGDNDLTLAELPFFN